MANHFADQLIHNIRSKRSCLVVGIDPRLEMLPGALLERYPSAAQDLAAAAECYRSFGRRVVELVAPWAIAVKPQIAFFERLGPSGIRAFSDVVQHARKLGLPVIADVKRSDIDTTAQAYAEAYLGPLPPHTMPPGIEVDAVTLNPYLGADSIRPFLDAAAAHGKGLFILVRTSNRSAGEFQDFQQQNVKLYEEVARRVAEWGKPLTGQSGYSSVGAVVGATYPEEATRLRSLIPQTLFLVPGYGAQGGRIQDVAPCFNPDGLGAIINASRSVIYAYRSTPEKDTFGEARWEAAIEAAARRISQELALLLAP